MSEFAKRELVFVVTAFVAAVMMIKFFLNIPAVTVLGDQIQIWALIIQLVAIGIGAINLLRNHLRHIQRRTAGRWPFSIWLIVLFAAMFLMGLGDLATGSKNPVYAFLFNEWYVSLGTTLYAITGFYIFSAAYRAFRARTEEAAVLLIVGCLIILMNAPVGEVIWSGFPVIGSWFMQKGQVPWQRAMRIIEGFGMMAFGFRTFLGKEKGFFAEAGETQ
jgi:hypothetical protein